MKRIIICYICKKPRQYKDSYAVKVEDYTDLEIVEKTVATGDALLRRVVGYTASVKKVRICRADAKRMGYKVKQK